MLHLTRILAGQLNSYGVRILALESVAAEQMADDKHLVLLYPIHGFNAPRNVKRFARGLPPALYETVSLVGVGCTTGWVNQAASSEYLRAQGLINVRPEQEIADCPAEEIANRSRSYILKKVGDG